MFVFDPKVRAKKKSVFFLIRHLTHIISAVTLPKINLIDLLSMHITQSNQLIFYYPGGPTLRQTEEHTASANVFNNP